jgi:hypothetical protein
MSHSAWRRVSRAHPCPICGKPGWCLVSANGTAAICPRVESPRRAGDAGWLHRLADAPTGPRRHVRHVRLTTAGPDLGPLAEQCRAALDPGRLHQLAAGLGLTPASLTALGVGWSAARGAYTFPMQDAGGRVVGVRLRGPGGRKWAVRGSKAGLHIPAGPPFRPDGQLLIAEGPTDCAALLDLGVPAAVGRYSCQGDLRLLAALARLWRPGEAVIVADADEPGRRGADNLASALVCYCPAVRVIVPPGGAKDARDFLRAGGTWADLEAAIDAAPVRRLRITTGRSSR